MPSPELPLHVAVGVVLDAEDRVLTALRPKHLHQGGLWEFPGGKVEPGETVCDALRREFREELDVSIETQHCHPLQTIVHHYPDKSVLLDVWTVSQISGQPSGLEGQEVRWQPLVDLDPECFPAANHRIIRTLRLPRRIAITPPELALPRIIKQLPAVKSCGVGLLQFRQPALCSAELQAALRVLTAHCERLDLILSFNGSVEQWQACPTAGLHLSSQRLMSSPRRPVPNDVLFSASCHDAWELQQARVADADFVTLSPVLATGSHPGVTGLGWERFRQLADGVSLPVYALGGLRESDMQRARAAGAHGIAAISAFWDN